MIECAWCGAELAGRRFHNMRAEPFCTVNHRSASNAALKRLTDMEGHKMVEKILITAESFDIDSILAILENAAEDGEISESFDVERIEPLEELPLEPISNQRDTFKAKGGA